MTYLRSAGLSTYLSIGRTLVGALVNVLIGPACVPVDQIGGRSVPASNAQPITGPDLPFQDQTGLEDVETEFEATNSRLEDVVGDLNATYAICERIAQDRPASRCWTKASQLNPELRDQICDHMLDHVDFPYDEECRLGVVWPLEY